MPGARSDKRAKPLRYHESRVPRGGRLARKHDDMPDTAARERSPDRAGRGAEPGSGPEARPEDPTCSFDDCACTGKNLVKFTSPAALLAVAEAGALSGYDIAERLRSMPLGGESGPDPGGIYRVLRRMERFNLLTSEWDTSGPGPARRVYRLTYLGDRCLDQWAETLRSHSGAVQSFLGEFERLREADRSRTQPVPGRRAPTEPAGGED
jgi:PadR family transcriptional regulator, regulatory protein PadR